MDLFTRFKVNKMNTSQLTDRLTKDKPYFLVDVRNREAFMKGHIPGASNMYDGEIMSAMKKIDKNTDVIVYGPGTIGESKLCNDAAKKFRSGGSRYVYAYEDGLQGWADAGNRVDHSGQKLT